MKKILLILLVSASIIIAYDNTNTQIHMKDTVITKAVNDGLFSYQLLQNIISVIIGGLLTWFGVHLSNKHQKLLSEQQIQHQLKIKQTEFNVETKRKLIDNLISVSKESVKLFHSFIGIISEFNKAKKSYNIAYYELENHKRLDASDSIIYKIKLERMDLYSKKVTMAGEKLFNLSKEFYLNTSTTYLYINSDNKEYAELKKLNENVENSFDTYVSCFTPLPDESNTANENNINLREKCFDDFTNLRRKIKDLIDTERNEIDNLLIKKSELETSYLSNRKSKKNKNYLDLNRINKNET